MKSIRAKITIVMVSLCIGILVLVWVLTVGLFESFYNQKIQSSLLAALTQVMGLVDENGGTSSADSLEIEQIARSGICIEISPAGGTVGTYYEGIGDSCAIHHDRLIDFSQGLNQKTTQLGTMLRSEIRRNGSCKVEVPNALGGRQVIVGGLSENGGTIVIVSANLERVTQALGIIRRQLLYVSIVALAVAVLVAVLLARWFTKPITTLSAAARKMAEGDYTVAVTPASSDELGVLTEEFNRMANEVGKSIRLQQELIANFSHDLRTPLTVIKGYAESIRDLSGDDRTKRNEQLAVIVEESDRLSALVNSALEFSQYSSGAVSPKREHFDANEMLQDMAGRHGLKARQQGVSIVVEANADREVDGDPALLVRVLENLLSNAEAHVTPGKTIWLSAAETEQGLRIEVRDNGEGISKEDLPHLFDRYYRARQSEGKQGTGLGLAIVKAILESHGYPYGINSELNEGTAVWFIAAH